MKHGVLLMNMGDLADPRVVARFARAAEVAGWDGLFLWDHLGFAWGSPSGDCWTSLAYVAGRTERIVLGAGVSPLARYRPWVLANALAGIDIATGGRLVLGAGLGGAPEEFAAFCEPSDQRTRAAMTDEALVVIAGLWSGAPVTDEGRFYRVRGVTLAPRPVQRPRIPIWIGGMSEGAMRRAARWDGWMANAANPDCRMDKSPAQMAGLIAHLRELGAPERFEIAIDGYSEPGDRALVAEYAAAGVTWWQESLHGYRGSTDALLARVEGGPAR